MKINKHIWGDGDYYHYYVDNKTGIEIWYGLYNGYYILGYRYHEERKGFWLKKEKYL